MEKLRQTLAAVEYKLSRKEIENSELHKQILKKDAAKNGELGKEKRLKQTISEYEKNNYELHRNSFKKDSENQKFEMRLKNTKE